MSLYVAESSLIIAVTNFPKSYTQHLKKPKKYEAVTFLEANNRNLSHVLFSIISNVSEGVTLAVTFAIPSSMIRLIAISFWIFFW